MALRFNSKIPASHRREIEAYVQKNGVRPRLWIADPDVVPIRLYSKPSPQISADSGVRRFLYIFTMLRSCDFLVEPA